MSSAARARQSEQAALLTVLAVSELTHSGLDGQDFGQDGH